MNNFRYKSEPNLLNTFFCRLGLKTHNFTKNVWAH